MEPLTFDTTFLIDLQRELARKRPARAHSFLSRHQEAPAHISVVSLGEYAEGFPKGDAHLDEMRRGFSILPIDELTALIYAQWCRQLRAAGNLINSNDLWIAASALRNGFPLVTRDVDHFARITDLRVIEY